MAQVPQHPAKQSTVPAPAWLVVTFAAGLACGVVIDRLAFSPGKVVVLQGALPEGANNPTVTRENFAKIKPDMSAWEVPDLLGPGQLLSEEGQVVEPSGQYRKWRRGGGVSQEESGTLSRHDGKASQQVHQERCWKAEDKAIYVTFVNGRVTAKREKGLY